MPSFPFRTPVPPLQHMAPIRSNPRLRPHHCRTPPQLPDSQNPRWERYFRLTDAAGMTLQVPGGPIPCWETVFTRRKRGFRAASRLSLKSTLSSQFLADRPRFVLSPLPAATDRKPRWYEVTTCPSRSIMMTGLPCGRGGFPSFTLRNRAMRSTSLPIAGQV